MPTHSPSDKLSNKKYVTVILRLLINGQGRLVRGEVVDIEGQSQGRFSGWQRLEKAIRDALNIVDDDDTEDPSPSI